MVGFGRGTLPIADPYEGARSARQISEGLGGLPYISAPTRYSLPASSVSPQIASSDPPMATPICHAGTELMATRVNISIGLMSGTIEAQTNSGFSGSFNAKIDKR